MLFPNSDFKFKQLYAQTISNTSELNKKQFKTQND